MASMLKPSRTVFLLVALAVLAAVFAALLLHLHQSDYRAAEREAQLKSHFLVLSLQNELNGMDTGGKHAARPDVAAPVHALLDTAARRMMDALPSLEPRPWSGLLVDDLGRVVIVQPPDFLEAAHISPQAIAKAHAQVQGPSERWVLIQDIEGAFRPAYLNRTPQGWAWIVPLSCGAPLECTVSRTWQWIGGGVLLLVLACILVVRTASRKKAVPDTERTQTSAISERREETFSTQDRWAVVGRMAGRFAHEFNNQLGIMSNSAYLIQRRTTDPKLALPTQAMLRAVDAASLLTQFLQRLGAGHATQTQAIDLTNWLEESETTFTMVLGKRIPLDLQIGTEPLGVSADPEILELALIIALLHIRAALHDIERVSISAAVMGPDKERELLSGRYAEILVVAKTSGESSGPVTWKLLDIHDEGELGLLQRLCQSMEGCGWSGQNDGGHMAVSITLPMPGEDLPAQSA